MKRLLAEDRIRAINNTGTLTPKDVYQLVLDATDDRELADKLHAQAHLNKTMDQQQWTRTNS